MPRYKVTGRIESHVWDGAYDAVRYVDAADRDSAIAKASPFLAVPIEEVREVREVPEHEGRGWLWRLWRWVVKSRP